MYDFHIDTNQQISEVDEALYNSGKFEQSRAIIILPNRAARRKAIYEKVNMLKLQLTFILLILSGCLTNKNSTLSDAEKCNLQPNYQWSQGKCVFSDSIAQRKKRCEAQNDGSKWVQDRCLSLEQRITNKAECLNEGVGYQWFIDQKTGVGVCQSPYRRVEAAKECALREQGAKWIDNRCVTAEGRRCLAGGDFWSIEERCVSHSEHACNNKTDGSKWLESRCVTYEEQRCWDLGYAYTYEHPKCRRKTFVELCKAQNNPMDLQHTIDELKKLFSNNCDKSWEILKVQTGLDLSNKQISNLYPLAYLDLLESLDLQNNLVEDVIPLRELPALTFLRLTRNKIKSTHELRDLNKLETLYLSYNEISELSGLMNMNKLGKLFLNHNKISSIKKIGGLSSLNSLSFLNLNQNCDLKDVTELTNLASLNFLFLEFTGIKKKNLPYVFVNRPGFHLEHKECK